MFDQSSTPSLASSGGRSGEMRMSGRPTGKWRKSGNAGWGPPADAFSTGDPTLRDQPTSPCSPLTTVAPHRQLRMIAEARLSQCTGSVPRHVPLTPESQHCHTHLAFLHCYDIRAFFVYVFHCPRCRPFTDLGALVFLAPGWSFGAFSGCLKGRIERALIDMFQEFQASICPWGKC